MRDVRELSGGPRRGSAVLTVAAAAAIIAGCSADAAKFRGVAERAIVDVLGDGSRAECAEPTDTDVGTTFTCTGTDASGRELAYTAEITRRQQVTVRPGG